MEQKKNCDYYLKKIMDDIDYVILNTKDITYELFIKNNLLCDSVCFRFIQMSENAKKLKQLTLNDESKIPFQLLIALKNRIVHDYGSIDLHTVYKTAVYDLPELKRAISELE